MGGVEKVAGGEGAEGEGTLRVGVVGGERSPLLPLDGAPAPADLGGASAVDTAPCMSHLPRTRRRRVWDSGDTTTPLPPRSMVAELVEEPSPMNKHSSDVCAVRVHMGGVDEVTRREGAECALRVDVAGGVRALSLPLDGASVPAALFGTSADDAAPCLSRFPRPRRRRVWDSGATMTPLPSRSKDAQLDAKPSLLKKVSGGA